MAPTTSEKRNNSGAPYILLFTKGTLHCQLDRCEFHSNKITYAGKVLNVLPRVQAMEMLRL
jgi:hypothetical protein